MDIEIVFSPPLRPAVLLKRYKRFLADVRFESGNTTTALCPNTGSMLSCSEPGREILLSYHPEPSRKHRYTWEAIRMDDGWVGVNTGLPNVLVERALRFGAIPELSGFNSVRREIRLGERSRLDFFLEGPGGRCWLEVKSVTLAADGAALFPDAVTERGLRHIEELENAVRAGERGALLFLVQRPGGGVFRPADHIDPAYGAALRRAAELGVEILAYRAEMGPERLRWAGVMKKDLSAPRGEKTCSTK